MTALLCTGVVVLFKMSDKLVRVATLLEWDTKIGNRIRERDFMYDA